MADVTTGSRSQRSTPTGVLAQSGRQDRRDGAQRGGRGEGDAQRAYREDREARELQRAEQEKQRIEQADARRREALERDLFIKNEQMRILEVQRQKRLLDMKSGRGFANTPLGRMLNSEKKAQLERQEFEAQKRIRQLEIQRIKAELEEIKERQRARQLEKERAREKAIQEREERRREVERALEQDRERIAGIIGKSRTDADVRAAANPQEIDTRDQSHEVAVREQQRREREAPEQQDRAPMTERERLFEKARAAEEHSREQEREGLSR